MFHGLFASALRSMVLCSAPWPGSSISLWSRPATVPGCRSSTKRSRAVIHFTFRHALANFPKHFLSGESLLPFRSMFHFMKWTSRPLHFDRVGIYFICTSYATPHTKIISWLWCHHRNKQVKSFLYLIMNSVQLAISGLITHFHSLMPITVL